MFRYNPDQDQDYTQEYADNGQDIMTLSECIQSIQDHNFEVMRSQLPIYLVEDLPLSK